MPEILHEHVTSPPQTLPDTVLAADTLASQSDESLVISQAQEQTVEVLVAQSHRQQQRFRLLLFGLLGITLAVSLPMALSTAHFNAFALLAMLNVLLLGGGLLVFRSLRKWTANASALQNYDDVRTVGAFAEMLVSPIANARNTARKALIALLPRLEASDAALLDSKQRQLLSRFLGGLPLRLPRQDLDLALAILKAYEQIGDGTDLPIVERLAQGHGWAADPEVRAAAIACLLPLRQQADLKHDTQTLLRASADTAVAGDVLLRPAQGASHTDVGQMLRAAPQDPASENMDNHGL